MYIDKLGDIDNKYNTAYHKTIKKKLVVVNSSLNIDFNKENSQE